MSSKKRRGNCGAFFVFAALSAAVFLGACSQRQQLPPLPAVDTTRFLPVIGNAISAAMRDAQAKPNDSIVVGRFGMVLQAHEQLAAARACYQRAHLLDEDAFDWIYLLGTAQLADGQAADAAQSFRQAVKVRPKDFALQLKLGDALQATGDSAGAKAVYQAALELKPGDPAALFGYGRAANDPASFEKALAAFPQHGAAMFALAQHYRRAGRNADADALMRNYERFKTVAPPVEDPLLATVDALNRSATRLIRMAAVAESRGDLAAALDLQLKAVEADPSSAQAYVNLISLYGRQGRVVEAEQAYRKALAASPNSHEAHYNFGVLAQSAGRIAEARAAYEKALKIQPGYAVAHNNLGALLQEQGRIDEAAAHFAKALAADPSQRLARFHLGRIEANRGRWREAIRQFEEIVREDDEATPTYLYALGAAYARTGQMAESRKALEDARQRAAARGQAGLVAAIERDLGRLK